MAKLESGTRIYGNVTVDTFVTAVGNITGGNLLTTGLFSATANVTANNGMFTNIVNVASHTGAVVSVTGNITANNGMFTNIVNVASHTGAVVSVTGNVTGGNILTAGLISATGNITVGNISAVGGISGLINPRTVTTTSNAAVTPNIAVYDQYNYTALAVNLTINAPTGSPVDGNKILFRIIDNGTTRTLTWNATYTAIGVTLPTATTASKMVYVGCVYNSTNTRWDAIAVSTQA